MVSSLRSQRVPARASRIMNLSTTSVVRRQWELSMNASPEASEVDSEIAGIRVAIIASSTSSLVRSESAARRPLH